jgi:hypothetical protein
MSEPEDPSRLFDDPSAPAGLKNVLRGAKADVGGDAQIARLAERLGPVLGGGAAIGAGAVAASTGTALSGTAKLGLAALALAAAGGGAWWLVSGDAPPPRAAPVEVASSAPVLAPAPAVTNAVPAPLPSRAAEPGPSASPTPTHEKPALAVQLTEVELLEQARVALKTDPNRALQRVNEHARRFPRGVLVQEREILAIQALRRLGRDADAERRSEAFAKAFPGSAFQRNLKPSP